MTKNQILEKIVKHVPGMYVVDPNKLASYLYSLQGEKLEGKGKCDFEGDGYKHQCYACEVGQVENCKKCHRDRCNNPECKNSKEYNEKECGAYEGCICNDPTKKNETCKACMAGFRRAASYIGAGGGKLVEPQSEKVNWYITGRGLVVALHRNNKTMARKDFLGAYDTEKEAIKVRDEIKVRYGGGKVVEEKDPTPPEWEKELDEIIYIHINGEETREEVTVDLQNFISNILKEERSKNEKREAMVVRQVRERIREDMDIIIKDTIQESNEHAENGWFDGLRCARSSITGYFNNK